MNLNRTQLKQLMYGMSASESRNTNLFDTTTDQSQAVSPPDPIPIEPTPVKPSPADPNEPVAPEQPTKPAHPADPTEPTHPQVQPGYLNTPAIGNEEDQTLFDSANANIGGANNFPDFERPDSMRFFIVS